MRLCELLVTLTYARDHDCFATGVTRKCREPFTFYSQTFFFFFCTVPYGNVRSLHSDSCCFVYKGSMELSGHQSSIPASAFSTVVIRLRATLFDTGQSTPWEALIGLQLACSQLSPGLATTPVSPTAWRWVTLLLLCPPDNLQGYHHMS